MNFIERTVKSIFGPMQFRCPSCDAAMDMSNVNFREEVAMCPVCGKLSKRTEVTRTDHSMQDLLASPPAGCSVTRDDQSIYVYVSLRSIPKFIGLFFESLILNVVFFVFLTGLFAAYFVGPLPAWFPFTKNGTIIVNGGPVGLNEALFATLFLTPFTVFGLRTIFEGLIRLVGKTSVGRSDSTCTVCVISKSLTRNFDGKAALTSSSK